MNEFKEWSRLFVVIVILSGVLYSLLPKDKSNSSVKTLYSVIILSMIILPFGDKNKYDFLNGFSDDTSNISEDELISYNDDFVSEITEEVIKSELDEFIFSINSEAIVDNVGVNVNEDQTISINVQINGSVSDTEKEKINMFLIGLYGGDVTVEYIE